ncbi:MAG TPA: hypothetical protein VFM38_06275 [Candidatus Limnocylindrales bacterium]|nr:hypothetical protein [Candidatus Limnocylindrales bacterium]
MQVDHAFAVAKLDPRRPLIQGDVETGAAEPFDGSVDKNRIDREIEIGVLAGLAIE